MNRLYHRAGRVLLLAGVFYVTGCSAAGRPSLMPNPDPNLRKTSTEFAADSVKRHPYKGDLPHAGQAIANAQVGYMMDWLEMVNLSDETWYDVELWVNRNWVVFLPKVEPKLLKRINFEMIYDDRGGFFPTDNNKVRVTDLTIVRDGKIYDVPLQLAD